MKKFTVIQRITQELFWEIEAEDVVDAKRKTVHTDKEPDFVKIVESEIDVSED